MRLAVWREEGALREAFGHYHVLVEDDPETFAEELEEVPEFLAELDVED
ncbi:hypothetical protein ACFYS8_20195 [Kitasatospora sp. NPDC004615]